MLRRSFQEHVVAVGVFGKTWLLFLGFISWFLFLRICQIYHVLKIDAHSIL